MDDSATIGSVKEKIKEFCDERDWDQYHNAKDLAIGVITEAAELLEHFRFKSTDEAVEILSEDKSREEVSDEMADIVIFLFRLAEKYGIDISDSVESKLKKNAEKYPARKSVG
ncbi:MAG: nucleotide pyrophosphohydrolase [archaeon]